MRQSEILDVADLVIFALQDVVPDPKQVPKSSEGFFPSPNSGIWVVVPVDAHFFEGIAEFPGNNKGLDVKAKTLHPNIGKDIFTSSPVEHFKAALSIPNSWHSHKANEQVGSSRQPLAVSRLLDVNVSAVTVARPKDNGEGVDIRPKFFNFFNGSGVVCVSKEYISAFGGQHCPFNGRTFAFVLNGS